MSTTNFITPPDFVDEEKHTLLLIDVDPVDVETLAYLCGGHNESFNIYLYKADFNDLNWLHDCAYRADGIIINTVDNSINSIKATYAEKTNAYHYGPKTLNEERKHNGVLDYFVIRTHEQNDRNTK